MEVRDEGIGIPAEELRRIFDSFYQVDGSTTRSYPGAGIGLAVSKEIVERHGGRIEVESEPGQGTSFLVFLPTEPLPLPVEAVGAASENDSGHNEKQVDGSEKGVRDAKTTKIRLDISKIDR